MVLNLLIFVTSWSAGLALPRSQIAVSMKSAISSPSSQLILGKEIGSGTYGAVYEAQWQQDGTVIDAVAKVARPRTDSDAVLAKQYLDIEAVVYDSLEERRKGRADLDGFCKYVGRTELDGEEWLLWERLPGCGELPRAITLAELNHETGEEAGRETVDEPIWSLSLSSFGLTSRDVLREVLRLTGKLHETGFVHRDIKTANLLLSASEPASTPSIYLIDMGSCAKMLGCTLLDDWLGNCAGYDSSRSPCSPLFAAPEGFLDPQHPFAFDVFSIGIVFLRLSWPSLLHSDAQLAAFRAQLLKTGSFEAWLNDQLSSTIIPPGLVEALKSFPGDTEEPLQAVGFVAAMLRDDPSRRPDIATLLRHPFVEQSASKSSLLPPRMASELMRLLGSEGCILPKLEVDHSHLSVRVDLLKPFGLLLGEIDDDVGGVAVDELFEGGSAAGCGKLQVGDRLVSVAGKPVRGLKLDEVMALIGQAPRKVALLFERDCEQEGCILAEPEVTPPSKRLNQPITTTTFGVDFITDAGVAISKGGREYQEDTHILTTFTVRPPQALVPELPEDSLSSSLERKYMLAAVFDGHRGSAASEFASESMPFAVRAALERCEPSPLAAAWRDVCDKYLETNAQSGCTATAILVDGEGSCEVLNVGDSRTVFAKAKDNMPVVVYATRDHTPSHSLEIDRINSLGGRVDCSGGDWRVKVKTNEGTWLLGVARAMGGSEWRSAGVTDTADVTSINLNELVGGFIVLASDGIWGELDSPGSNSAQCSEVVASIVHEEVHVLGHSASQIAHALVQRAARAGGTDNACCIVLRL